MIEDRLVKELLLNNITITTVESCTGGMIASRIVNVPGASNVFSEGYVTYSEVSKSKLVGVKQETISKYNVVSEEVANEMAFGGAKKALANMAISVTGVAGPEGGTDKIPVGTVCIGVFLNGNVVTRTHIFDGDRLSVRTQATNMALEMALDILKK